jgi:hypothetical protein
LYASLAAQLEAERAARQALEAQVKKLSERLNTLSTTMFAMVRGPTESRSQEWLTSSVGGNSPLPQPPPQSFVPVPVPQQQQQQLSPYALKALSALSGFDSDDDDDGEEDENDDDNELEAVTKGSGQAQPDTAYLETEGTLTEEDFQTQEDRPPLSYGAFGEELRPDDDDDDPKRKKAARTLSLSQLTLKKKSKQTQI